MSASTTITLTRALAELAEQSRQTKDIWLRVVRSDGTRIEGHLLSVEPTKLVLIDSATRAPVEIAPQELRTVDVRTPSQHREWMLAGVAIVGATVALVGYASLPWVRPDKGDVTGGFMVLYSAAGALLPVLLARTRLRRWLSKWQPMYPPPGA